MLKVGNSIGTDSLYCPKAGKVIEVGQGCRKKDEVLTGGEFEDVIKYKMTFLCWLIWGHGK